jgi:hypothetical protein
MEIYMVGNVQPGPAVQPSNPNGGLFGSRFGRRTLGNVLSALAGAGTIVGIKLVADLGTEVVASSQPREIQDLSLNNKLTFYGVPQNIAAAATAIACQDQVGFYSPSFYRYFSEIKFTGWDVTLTDPTNGHRSQILVPKDEVAALMIKAGYEAPNDPDDLWREDQPTNSIGNQLTNSFVLQAALMRSSQASQLQLPQLLCAHAGRFPEYESLGGSVDDQYKRIGDIASGSPVVLISKDTLLNHDDQNFVDGDRVKLWPNAPYPVLSSDYIPGSGDLWVGTSPAEPPLAPYDHLRWQEVQFNDINYFAALVYFK